MLPTMKKILISVLVILCSLTAKAWKPDFSMNRGYYSLGMLGGVIGFQSPQQGIGFGANVSVWGFSVDFVAYGPEHISTEEKTKWNDHESFQINLGYHIPIVNFLSIYPIVGYSERSTGVTDGTRYYYSYDSDTYTETRNNKYTRNWSAHNFNYGGGIAIKASRWLTIHLVATRWGMYGGIGLNFANLDL